MDKDIYLYRMFATIAIWLAFAGIMIFAGWNLNFVLALLLIVAAGYSTKVVWDYHEDFSQSRRGRASARRIAKTKRDENLSAARLLEVLDDGERDEIMRRLSAQQDGELVDLESLTHAR